MSKENKEYISLRIPASERRDYEALAMLFTEKEGKRVTLAHVLRELMRRGRPVVERELHQKSVPGVSFVTQPTRLEQLAGIAQMALQIGFEQIQSSSSSSQST